MRETRSRVPLERDKRGRRILTHDRGGYSRGCGCEACTADHTAEMKERRGPRRPATGPQDIREISASVHLSRRVRDMITADGIPVGQWLWNAALEKLSRDTGLPAEDIDPARRPAPRRVNYGKRRQADREEQES